MLRVSVLSSLSYSHGKNGLIHALLCVFPTADLQAAEQGWGDDTTETV